jgi:hypothetical protein
MVEFCTTTRELDEATRRLAHLLRLAESPEVDTTPPPIEFFEAAPTRV